MNPLWLSKGYYASSEILGLLPPKLQVWLSSFGRSIFMEQFVKHVPRPIALPDSSLKVSAWGLNFRSSLMNSAGMFKNGEGYDVIEALGAGGYIGGTSTTNWRRGNEKLGIKLPSIILPKSKMAVNWLGLPNLGDGVLAKQSFTANKKSDCPIGWSVMRSPDFNESQGVQLLIESLWLYHEHPQVDFIEINESCPNVKNGGGSIIPRLQLISDKFANLRRRNLPLIVKLSNDLTPDIVKELIPHLIRLGFDGVNLGNTSTMYNNYSHKLMDSERDLFDYFTNQFGGGVSGTMLKQSSLALCRAAAEEVEKLKPNHEFHIIRSGGINSGQDLIESSQNGVTLNQWYTGFFENFNKDGYSVYHKLYADLLCLNKQRK